ncbi:MAG: endonuclease III, partial [Patescibacteria group bacterium]
KKETGREFTKRKARALRIARALAKLFPDSHVFLSHGNPWELLVAVMLSAQCTDTQVNKVTATLFKKYRRLDDYLRVSASRRTAAIFERDIRSTGFYKVKTKNVLGAAMAIEKRFGGRVPKTMEELLELPGVGRKTANIVLWNAYHILSGIPVDTHVRRLAQVYGLTDEDDPNKIEEDLMVLLPKREWGRISYRLIEYGRRYCPARPHTHRDCPLTKIK